MKLLAVLGSTRPNSLSQKVAMEVVRGAKEAGVEVVIYQEDKMEVWGCKGCGSCKKNNRDCVIKDDMEDYFNDLHECDALLVAAPNYFSQVAGQMITFQNRHFCLMDANHKSRLKPGIKLLSVFSQGAPVGVPQYMQNYNWYVNCFKTCGMDIADSLIIGGNTDLADNGDIMTKAYTLGKNL